MNKIAMGLVVIPILLTLINMLRREASYISLGKVIKNHMSLFKQTKYQYVIFYIYPIFISIGIAYFTNPTDTFFEQENVVISILISALLAIMSILISKNYEDVEEEYLQNIKAVLKETINAIIFDVSIGAALMITNLIKITINIDCEIVQKIFAGVTYYLFIVMILTILLIIKRLGNLIDS